MSGAVVANACSPGGDRIMLPSATPVKTGSGPGSISILVNGTGGSTADAWLRWRTNSAGALRYFQYSVSSGSSPGSAGTSLVAIDTTRQWVWGTGTSGSGFLRVYADSGATVLLHSMFVSITPTP